LKLFAIRNGIPLGTVYEHWHDVAFVWPVQQGAGNAVKFTQGQGTDVIEESADQLRVRAQAWADEVANPVSANQVAAAWMTESGKFMQLVTGFICVSIVSLLVFLCMQYFYDVLNCDSLFIGKNTN
jgi:hypothetical protein